MLVSRDNMVNKSVEFYAEKVKTESFSPFPRMSLSDTSFSKGLLTAGPAMVFSVQHGKWCEVIVSGKLKAQGAKSMKFKDGYMIFSDPWDHARNNCTTSQNIKSLFGAISGPKYEGVYLRKLMEKILKKTRLEETLTSILIIAFHIKIFQPIVFTTEKAKRDKLSTPLLKEVCISTSAAPTYLLAQNFTIINEDTARSFDLID